MDLTDIEILKSILAKHGVRPNKYLGQHFLTSRRVLEKIVEAAAVSASEVILEIGPGLGVLTVELAKLARSVIAVEKDKKLAGILKDILATQNINNVEVVVGDILKNPEYKIGDPRYKIVANLPYYLTAAVIRKFLETPPAGKPPEEMTLMIQKEVAQRICGRPPEMTLLAVSVQYYGRPRIIEVVPGSSFWPQPEVDSAIIKIEPLKEIPPESEGAFFFEIVRAGFSQPRKKLSGNLAKSLKIDRRIIENSLTAIRLDNNSRAQNLSVDNWRELIYLLKKNGV